MVAQNAPRLDEAGTQVLCLYCAGPRQRTYLGSLVIADRSNYDVRRLVEAGLQSQPPSVSQGPQRPGRRFKLTGRLSTEERQGDWMAGVGAGRRHQPLESYVPLRGRILEVPPATVDRLKADGALVGKLLPGPFASGVRLLPEALHLQRLLRHLDSGRERMVGAG